MNAQVDLEELVLRCRSSNARKYIKEAVDCYSIGAYRACVITTWIALVYDLIDKLRELSFSGDSAAKAKVQAFDNIQKNRDTDAALKFEREALGMAKDEFELITVQEYNDLGRLFDDRNRCGHPNLNRDSEVYSPPPELARLHLRIVIEHVLARPPVQGKAALQLLHDTVDSDYFPTGVPEAQEILKATPLIRAKEKLVTDFMFGALISIVREVITEKKMLQRIAAAQATYRMYPTVVRSLLVSKFDEAIFKTPDNFLSRVSWLLVMIPDLQSFLKDATWTKLETYVRSMPFTEIDACLTTLGIPRLHEPSKIRILILTRFELVEIVARLKIVPNPTFIDHCVQLYSQSDCWNTANSLAESVIEPLIIKMNPAQAMNVILAGLNYEVRESNRYTGVVFKIKMAQLLTDEQWKSTVSDEQLKAKIGHWVPS